VSLLLLLVAAFFGLYSLRSRIMSVSETNAARNRRSYTRLHFIPIQTAPRKGISFSAIYWQWALVDEWNDDTSLTLDVSVRASYLKIQLKIIDNNSHSTVCCETQSGNKKIDATKRHLTYHQPPFAPSAHFIQR
jgi:hypothetical protein